MAISKGGTIKFLRTLHHRRWEVFFRYLISTPVCESSVKFIKNCFAFAFAKLQPLSRGGHGGRGYIVITWQLAVIVTCCKHNKLFLLNCFLCCAGAGWGLQAGGPVQGLPLQRTQALLRACTAGLYRFVKIKNRGSL